MSDAPDPVQQRAEMAREKAHAHITGNPVGAAVRTADGLVFGGANIESHGRGTVHAEQAAVLAAFAGGSLPRSHVAEVYIDGTRPCGSCLHFLAEYGKPSTVVRVAGDHRIWALWELLPLGCSL